MWRYHHSMASEWSMVDMLLVSLLPRFPGGKPGLLAASPLTSGYFDHETAGTEWNQWPEHSTIPPYVGN
jgi:hypothetical protein